MGRLGCVTEAVLEGVVAVLDPKIVAAVEAVGAVNPAGFDAGIDLPEVGWLGIRDQTGSLAVESHDRLGFLVLRSLEVESCSVGTPPPPLPL